MYCDSNELFFQFPSRQFPLSWKCHLSNWVALAVTSSIVSFIDIIHLVQLRKEMMFCYSWIHEWAGGSTFASQVAHSLGLTDAMCLIVTYVLFPSFSQSAWRSRTKIRTCSVTQQTVRRWALELIRIHVNLHSQVGYYISITKSRQTTASNKFSDELSHFTLELNVSVRWLKVSKKQDSILEKGLWCLSVNDQLSKSIYVKCVLNRLLALLK